jgi:hypothetical protein
MKPAVSRASTSTSQENQAVPNPRRSPTLLCAPQFHQSAAVTSTSASKRLRTREFAPPLARATSTATPNAPPASPPMVTCLSVRLDEGGLHLRLRPARPAIRLAASSAGRCLCQQCLEPAGIATEIVSDGHHEGRRSRPSGSGDECGAGAVTGEPARPLNDAWDVETSADSRRLRRSAHSSAWPDLPAHIKAAVLALVGTGFGPAAGGAGRLAPPACRTAPPSPFLRTRRTTGRRGGRIDPERTWRVERPVVSGSLKRSHPATAPPRSPRPSLRG